MNSFFKKAAAAAAIATLTPTAAIAASVPTTAGAPSKAELELSEGLAQRIAEAIYRVDFLNPELDGSIIDGVIEPVLTDAGPTPDMRRYIGEILSVWFASQPRITESVLRTIPEYSERIELVSMETDSEPELNDETQGIISFRRILSTKPPRAVSRGSSDY